VLHDFKLLSQPRQYDQILQKGVYLMSFKKYNVIIKLFQLENFYAEVYSFDEDNKIAMINAFEDTKYLEPYLENVDVSMLI
jgi:hypothetical protein